MSWQPLVFFYDGPAGPPEGAASCEALAVPPSLSSARTACTLKGGCLSITTQGSYWLSSPHPLALSTASRPDISGAPGRGRRDHANPIRHARKLDPHHHSSQGAGEQKNDASAATEKAKSCKTLDISFLYKVIRLGDLVVCTANLCAEESTSS